MSFGSQYGNQAVHRALQKAIQHGIFVIAAAGNDAYRKVDYPAAHPECVAVGSIDRRLQLTTYSSYTCSDIRVDIVAPGDQIMSSFPSQQVASMSGTSMATPFVTGVVALMLARQREEGSKLRVRNQQELIQRLRETAIDIGPARPDPKFGFGLINPLDLVDPQ